MLFTQEKYYLRFRNGEESKEAFINRVLVPKFGRTNRSWYNDVERTYILKVRGFEYAFKLIKLYERGK